MADLLIRDARIWTGMAGSWAEAALVRDGRFAFVGQERELAAPADAETLDLLEEQLIQYQGTLLIVSHDREFLDQVVTSLLVFEGDGYIGDYVGGYSDWLQRRQQQASAKKEKSEPKAAPRTRQRSRKLGFLIL